LTDALKPVLDTDSAIFLSLPLMDQLADVRERQAVRLGLPDEAQPALVLLAVDPVTGGCALRPTSSPSRS